ncbi:hypothetical protein F5148DRAFT_138785 [Russula earlei]|uniref:Uncharacterized protein n=1 Tax=Russula earlei TaxID=71964 RepID=A0ACC0TRM0_9AGAM|nr:hypothetical protein F5148DRAFT_138785 [Russula earlei]
MFLKISFHQPKLKEKTLARHEFAGNKPFQTPLSGQNSHSGLFFPLCFLTFSYHSIFEYLIMRHFFPRVLFSRVGLCVFFSLFLSILLSFSLLSLARARDIHMIRCVCPFRFSGLSLIPSALS